MNNQKAATVDRFHDRVSFSIGDVTDTLYMSPEYARKFANQILITVGDIEERRYAKSSIIPIKLIDST